MNPETVSRTDWGLYFNNTYMLHEDHGVVKVRAGREYGFQVRTRIGAEWVTTTPDKLTCIWPTPRALNVGTRACFVGRRAVREARRSATAGHYFMRWHDGLDMTHEVMALLCHPPKYPTVDWAIDALRDGGYTSIAISRDLILSRRTKDSFRVISLGEPTCTVRPDDGSLWLMDTDIVSAADKRAVFKLEKEGWLCR